MDSSSLSVLGNERNEMRIPHIYRGKREKEEVTRVIILEDDTNPYASCPTAVLGSKLMTVGRHARRPGATSWARSRRVVSSIKWLVSREKQRKRMKFLFQCPCCSCFCFMKPKKGKPKEKQVKDKAAEKPKEKAEGGDDKPKGE
ncbi:hypothetical protein AgCh_037815 [Apium graveolens]